MHDAHRAGAGQEFGSQMLEAALQTAVGAIIIIVVVNVVVVNLIARK